MSSNSDHDAASVTEVSMVYRGTQILLTFIKKYSINMTWSYRIEKSKYRSIDRWFPRESYCGCSTAAPCASLQILIVPSRCSSNTHSARTICVRVCTGGLHERPSCSRCPGAASLGYRACRTTASQQRISMALDPARALCGSVSVTYQGPD